MIAGSAFAKIIDTNILNPISRGIVALLRWLCTRWDYVLAAICFLTAGGYLLFLLKVTHHIFWDINFYAAAVKAMIAGKSPYDAEAVLEILGLQLSSGFNYPPLVAEALYQFRWLVLTPVGQAFFVGACLVSWISIPYLLAGSPKNWWTRDFLYVWGLYLVLFGLAGMRLLVVANISAVLLALTVFSIVTTVRTGHYKVFWATILLCAYIKPYFLCFLLFPVILDKKYLEVIIFLCALLALHLSTYFFNEKLFLEYVRAVAFQQSNLNNLGFSLYTFATVIISGGFGISTSRATFFALGIHFIFALVVVMVAYVIKSDRIRPRRFDLFCCWLFVSAFLLSPRAFDYDLAVLVVPLVLLTRMLLIEARLGLAVAVCVSAFSTALLRSPAQFNVELSQWSSTFIMWAVWLGSAVHFLNSTRPALLSEPQGTVA